MKKGDMSINLIIVAAIALIILVILAVLLFTRVGGPLTNGTTCSGIGGQCIESSGNCNDDAGEGYILHPTASCSSGQKCCIKP